MRVREPEGEDVLDGLLAQIVIDPVDLLLSERLMHDLGQLAGAGEVIAERLLDHDPGKPVRPIELGGTHSLDDHREELRRCGQVVDPVSLGSDLGVDLLEEIAERREVRVVVESTDVVAQHRSERRPVMLVDWCARMALDRGMAEVAVLIVGHLRAGIPHERKPRRQETPAAEVVDRRQQLALGEVTRGAEDHKCGGHRGAADPQTGPERILDRSLDDAHAAPRVPIWSSRC